MMLLCDAHLHSSHSPLPNLEKLGTGALYLSCSAGPDDWLPLLKSKDIKPFLGLHPEKTGADRQAVLFRLEQIIRDNPGVGIGECGLDRRFYKTTSRGEQEEILSRQIRIAETYKRPVVLHQVGAPGALADVLTALKPRIPLMIHGFKEPLEILERYIRLDMFISLGPGMHWEDRDFLNTALRIPRDRLLLETDWPYCPRNLTPEETGIPESYSDCLSKHYRRVSSRLGIDINTLSRLVKENGTLFTD